MEAEHRAKASYPEGDGEDAARSAGSNAFEDGYRHRHHRLTNARSSARGCSPVTRVIRRSHMGKKSTAVNQRLHQPVAMQ